MSETQLFGAIDIGASSGRVVLAEIGENTLDLHEVHRFKNSVTEINQELYWDFDTLLVEIRAGLNKLADQAEHLGKPVVSIGIDTWAVDFGFIGSDGSLLSQPRAYRDPRNVRGVEIVDSKISRADLYRENGLQFLPFNSLYQLSLAGSEDKAVLDSASKFLLIPDLIAFKLTGAVRAEVTNASTTGLFDAAKSDWNWNLIERLGIPASLFASPISPGEPYGTLSPKDFGPMLHGTVVLAVGSHDTASAVVGVPAKDQNFAFVSSGTWSLVGLELDSFDFSEPARLAGFTNEFGVDSTNRFLKNVGGLWLLQESMRIWAKQGEPQDLETLLADAARVSAQSQIDVNEARFLPPGDMPQRIKEYCLEHGLPAPESKAEVTRCIVDSLSASYTTTIRDAQELSRRRVDRVHIVGGGSQNQLLCQQTADATGLPVFAGPVEATAIGNLAVQARSAEVIAGDLYELRSLIVATQEIREYKPRA